MGANKKEKQTVRKGVEGNNDFSVKADVDG